MCVLASGEYLTFYSINISEFTIMSFRYLYLISKNSATTMEVSMIIVVLVLLLCVTVPILIMASCLIYCLLSRQIKANAKLSSVPSTSISTIESATGETALTAPFSHRHASVVIGNDNVLNADNPAATGVYSYTRTPFGSRTTTTFGLGTSLKASWTTNGPSQGPDTLAAALEGVLALHRQLEELRLEQTEDHNINAIEYNV